MKNLFLISLVAIICSSCNEPEGVYIDKSISKKEMNEIETLVYKEFPPKVKENIEIVSVDKMPKSVSCSNAKILLSEKGIYKDYSNRDIAELLGHENTVEIIENAFERSDLKYTAIYRFHIQVSDTTYVYSYWLLLVSKNGAEKRIFLACITE